MRVHESHVTRFSMDSSLFDEICINCGETDGHGGQLRIPCPIPPEKRKTLKQYEREREKAIGNREKEMK
jgi:hypothetical protein